VRRRSGWSHLTLATVLVAAVVVAATYVGMVWWVALWSTDPAMAWRTVIAGVGVLAGVCVVVTRPRGGASVDDDEDEDDGGGSIRRPPRPVPKGPGDVPGPRWGWEDFDTVRGEWERTPAGMT
jgi:hypothetical protein